MSTKNDLLMIKGAISDLTDEEQATIKRVKTDLKELIKANGDMGFLAFTVAGLEIAIESEG